MDAKEPMILISLSEYNRLKSWENFHTTNNITVGYKYDISINDGERKMWMCRTLINGERYEFISKGIGVTMDVMDISLHK